MPAQQPTLDGTVPDPDTGLSYAEWCDHVRPAFVEAARSGKEFTTYAIAKDYDLPEPSNPRADWGNAAQRFAREGLIEHVTFDRSSRPTGERSAVGVWRGTRAAQAGRIA